MVPGQTENIGLWAVNGLTLEAPDKWQARERPKGMKFKHYKLIPAEDGEMAQWFTAVAALEEDLSLVSSTQAGWLITAYSSSSRESDALFGPQQALHSHTNAAHRGIHIRT